MRKLNAYYGFHRHWKSRSWIPNYFESRRTYYSLSEYCELCVMHLLYWVQQKIFLLINQNWLREMLLKKLFHIWWDVVTSLVKTIKSTTKNLLICFLITIGRYLSTASLRKDNTASFKKQKIETIARWYSLIIILSLLSCTLRYLPPRSVLICQRFHHPQLTYFATPLI